MNKFVCAESENSKTVELEEWSTPRVISTSVARKTNKATTTFTSSEIHIPGTTNES